MQQVKIAGGMGRLKSRFLRADLPIVKQGCGVCSTNTREAVCRSTKGT